MANKPLDPVQFTRESAERVARVVRAAELASPRSTPLSFAPLQDFRGTKVVKVATFTGAWAIGDTKTVTLKYNTAATALATNLFFPLGTASSARDCLIGKSDGTWFLASVPMRTATAIFVTSTATAAYASSVTSSRQSLTYVSSVSGSFDPDSCSISISYESGTANYVSDVSAVTASMTVITTTATSFYINFAG